MVARAESVCLIVNPFSQRMRVSLQGDLGGISMRGARLCYTTAPGHAADLAQQAVEEGFERIVAGGGDGTVNEVVSGMVRSSSASRVILGVLPLGTMNVFALEMGIPRDLETAWHIARYGGVRTNDLPMANGRPFLQLAGIGYDGDIVAAVTSPAKARWGAMAYLMAAMRVGSRPLPRFEVELEGEGVREAEWVLVGNGRFYGGPIPVFRGAAVDDGLLDVVVVKRVTPFVSAAAVAGVMAGRLDAVPGVECFRGRRVAVRGPVAAEIDGEYVGHGDMTLDVGRQTLRVACV